MGQKVYRYKAFCHRTGRLLIPPLYFYVDHFDSPSIFKTLRGSPLEFNHIYIRSPDKLFSARAILPF